MIDREAQIRRAVVRMETAFPSGTGGWAKKRFELWVDSLIDLDPEAVTHAALDLIRTWEDDRGRSPQIGHLRSRAESYAKRHSAEKRADKRDQEQAEPTPEWWVRLVQGALYASIRRQGGRVPVGARVKPFMEIVERYELTTEDLCPGGVNGGDGRWGSSGERRVREAIAEAEGVPGFGGEADAGILGEMVGASAKGVQ